MTKYQGSRLWQLCLMLLVALFLPLAGLAQSSRGSLAGSILDPSGAVIADAHIVATQVETGAKYEATSSSAGAYRFPELGLGRYDVTATSTGFASSTMHGVLITINSTTALNVTLKPGAATESVTVDATAPSLESESSDVSGTISQQQIVDLPLSMAAGVGGIRSPETFAFLVPGTTGPGSAASGTAYNGNGVFLGKLAGGQTYGSETLLDGASIQRSENGSSFDETSPTMEVLQEFKVTTAIPAAEFGRTTAGVESFAIKGGTNTFHGTAFTYVKNAVTEANTWKNKAYWYLGDCDKNPNSTACTAYKRGADNKYNYGGDFSGPVRIPHIYNGTDKTFFMFGWEQYKKTEGGSTTSTVPTAAEKTGDFSDKLGDETGEINLCDGSKIYRNQIFDPSTSNADVTALNPNGTPCRKAYAGNKVTKINSVASALMKGMPDPNQKAVSTDQYGDITNYAQAYKNPIVDTTYTVRLDHQFNSKNHLYGSYSSRDNWRVAGAVNLPKPFNNSGYLQDFETHYQRIGWDYTISDTLMNHLNLGYNRTNSVNYAYQVNSPDQNLETAGAPNFYTASYPILNWNGNDHYSSWGVGNNSDNIDNGLRVNESIVWQHGRHSIKAGVDWRYQQYSMKSANIPTIDFDRGQTDAQATNDQASKSGNSFASFLAGDSSYAAQTVYNRNPRWNSWYIAGFIQDDFKVTPTLTLNLGLRYDVDVPRKEAANNTSAFSFTAADSKAGGLPGALVFGTTCKGCNTRWADTWKKDVAPRVGFAWILPHMDGKAVLRGGAGIIYAPLQYSDFGGSMQLGWTQTRTVSSIQTTSDTRAGFTPAFNLSTGPSAWTKSYFAPNTDPTQLDGGPGNPWAVGGEVITPKMGRPGMTTSWQLQIQDELAQDLILTVGYIGSVSQNLHSGYLTNSNNMSSKYFSLGGHLYNSGDRINTAGGSSLGVNAPYSTFVGTVGQALRPFPQYDYIAGDCCLENIGHSSYEAMLLSLNRHFRQGFNLQASYTFSKNLTDADSAIPFSYDGYRSQTQNTENLHDEKAVSIQNVPNQLSISYIVEFPFGKGKHFLSNSALLDRVVGGWSLSGIHRYQTGENVDFGCGWSAPYFQNCFRYTKGATAAGDKFGNAAYLKNKNKANFMNGTSWFKKAYRPAGEFSKTDPGVALADAAFVDMNHQATTTTGQEWQRVTSPTCADGCSFDPYVFGKGIPRISQALTGPVLLSEDFSLIKKVRLASGTNFEFKLDAVNIFNRHRMGMPDMQPYDQNSSTGFGLSNYSVIDPRSLQLSGRFNF